MTEYSVSTTAQGKTVTIALSEKDLAEIHGALENRRNNLAALKTASLNSLDGSPIDADVTEFLELKLADVNDIIAKMNTERTERITTQAVNPAQTAFAI